MKSKNSVKTRQAESIKQQVGLFNLRAPAGSHKRRKYLGRGSSSGHGKTSTRGSKGQTSRAGRHFYLGFEGGQSPLIRKMPKRGFASIFRKEYQIINLANLAKLKEATINPEVLALKGLIKDKTKLIKVLGRGEIKKAVTIQAHAFSKKAAEEIKKSGGTVEVINV
ncbi:MAG: 50S ribosomal protein L15 [Candidatus Omnitrophica bacterium]|nr:50S ribosomal protein L15 [Candidatus Omnitrophota bacterium]MDD5026986.1 50S ribosomal protein L15 [Candidatus Omnitrophota bacterium]MDD5661682.1 50S ribosomal protein L15 [Candidatus Omnitrophota bacterium]